MVLFFGVKGSPGRVHRVWGEYDISGYGFGAFSTLTLGNARRGLQTSSESLDRMCTHLGINF